MRAVICRASATRHSVPPAELWFICHRTAPAADASESEQGPATGSWNPRHALIGRGGGLERIPNSQQGKYVCLYFAEGNNCKQQAIRLGLIVG